MEHRFLRPLHVCLAHADPVQPLILHQIVHQGKGILHFPGYHAQVLTPHQVLLHLLAEPSRRFAGAGKHHQAAYRPIHPVHKPQINVAGFLILDLHILLQFSQHVRIPGFVRLGKHVGGLHRHNDLIILINDLRHNSTFRWHRRAARPRWSPAGTAPRCPPCRRNGKPRTSPACCSAHWPESRWYSC